MSERPTPETDAVRAYEGNWDTKALRMTAHARKMERERDEAREALRTLAEHGENEIQKLIKERDEAREQAQQMSESNQVLLADVRFYRNAWEQLKEVAK